MVEATPAAADLRIERYRDGDEAGILELFETVFGKKRSRAHWTWQFKQNPYAGPFVSTARSADGKVVASYSVAPIQLNHLGRPVLACQSVDTAVHPDHRGQRLFERTATDCYDACAAAGLQAVVGFPNASSYPGFMRGLAWKRIVFPNEYRLLLRLPDAARRALSVLAWPVDLVYRAVMGMRLAWRRAFIRRLAGPLVLRCANAVPVGYEALWNAWKNQEVLSVWKDAKYFEWRYDRDPDYEFEYFTLEHGGQMVALAVGVEIDRALALCELMVAARDVAAGRLLVTEIARVALGRGLRAVGFLGCDAGLFDEVFKGFARTRSFANVLGGRAFAAGPLADDLPHGANWTVTFGDGDFV